MYLKPCRIRLSYKEKELLRCKTRIILTLEEVGIYNGRSKEFLKHFLVDLCIS